MSKRLLLIISIALIAMISVMSFSCAKKNLPPKDKIRVGASRSLSGPLAFFENTAYGPIYKMWVKEVNDAGGIFVKEYNKKMPIELIVYDDKSDMATMTKFLTKLIVDDKCDFVLAPIDTAFLKAAAGITNKYKKILIGAEGGLTSIRPEFKNYPYLFGNLAHADWYQLEVVAKMWKDLGIKTVGIIFIEDQHGIDYSTVAKQEFAKVGIEVKMSKGVPPTAKDISQILKEAKSLNVDAFLAATYPPISFNVITQSQELNINFKALLVGPGLGYDSTAKNFGNDVVEGIMGYTTWSRKSSKEANDFADRYAKFDNPDNLDWWGTLTYYAGLQMLEQSIIEAGTLDNTDVMKVMKKKKLNTVLGPTWYETIDGGGALLAKECYFGMVGQFQNGVYEIIGGNKPTAKPIFPKPEWPAVKKKKK